MHIRPLKMCVNKHLCDIWQGIVILLNTCCAWQEQRASVPAHLVLPTPSDVSLSRWEDLVHASWDHRGRKLAHSLSFVQYQHNVRAWTEGIRSSEGGARKCVGDVQCPSSCWGATALMCLEGSVFQGDATCQIKPSSTLWPLPSMTNFRTSHL